MSIFPGNHTETTFESLRDAVHRLARTHLRTGVGKRPSASSVATLATQVTAVTVGIRSAHLLDITIDQTCLAPFLNQFDLPSDLAVCYEESTEQVFFLNISLIRQRIKQRDFPIWIATANSPPRTTSIPSSFTHLISTIESLPLQPRSVHVLRAENPLDMIPLSAFLLEYPFGYVVESPSQAGLVDISLIVIELYLSSPRERVPLLKFSVPECCASENQPLIDLAKFQQRLLAYPSLGDVLVDRNIEYFYRVAL